MTSRNATVIGAPMAFRNRLQAEGLRRDGGIERSHRAETGVTGGAGAGGVAVRGGGVHDPGRQRGGRPRPNSSAGPGGSSTLPLWGALSSLMRVGVVDERHAITLLSEVIIPRISQMPANPAKVGGLLLTTICAIRGW